MTRMTRRALAAIACAAAFTVAPASAQDQQRIGAFKFWSAFTTNGPDGKVCWAATAPVDAEFSGGDRGDVFLMVSSYPKSGVSGEVSLISGYSYDEGKTVQAKVGSDTFSFFAVGDGAWLETRQEEQRMIRAMKAGLDATVTGYASKGGRSTDKFSLLGFTAAFNAAADACK